jgi:hypothetical protein
MKNELQQEIQSLIEHLEKSLPHAESTEGVVIEHLRCLLKKADDSESPEGLSSNIAEFKRFWIESVPWCSQLSGQIEKIIILYDEFNDRINNEQSKS